MLTRRRHVLVTLLPLAAMPCLFAALALLAAGCGDGTPPVPTGPESLQPPTVDKPAAAQIDADALRTLGGGKREARDWLKDDSHTIFFGDKAQAVKLVDDLYAAGAGEVVVTGFDKPEDPKVASGIGVTLPAEPEARKKIFYLQAQYLKDAGSATSPMSDIGQKFLLLGLME